MEDIYFLQEKSSQAWSIRSAKNANMDVKQYLLFIHAITGCDTTSYLFGMGKVAVANLVRKSRHLQVASKTFMKIDSAPDEVGEASITAVKILYIEPMARLLTKISYQKFMQISHGHKISPKTLPTSERAAYFHGLRAYHQVMQWVALKTDADYSALDRGSKKIGNTLSPIATDIDYAPPCF